MPTGRMQTVVKRLRQSALFDAGVSDGELLERYLAQRDEAAFAALVRRHGPLVLGVCRRILRDSHDADDAFQATFLVLVRKAHAVIPRERVGPWLYGVAYRTSLKAKAMSSRRRAKQKALEDVPGPPPPADTDWVALLDQEVQRLPEKYRLPVVLCDLEGKTRKQAARQLGWPEGTVATRLQHGRSLVQKRLARFGLPAAAGAMTLVWAKATAAASLPTPLLSATVKAASTFAAGKLAGLIPLNVVALAQGVLKAMVITKIKNTASMLIVMAVLGLTFGLAASSRSVAGDDPGGNTQVGQPAPTTERTPLSATANTSGPRSEGRLPTGPAPVQALVSYNQGTVIVRMQQGAYYQPRKMVDPAGRHSTVYELVHAMRTDTYNRDQVQVFDTRCRKLDNKDMAKWLKEEIVALVQVGSYEIDPLHLRLIKEGTLVFVLPARIVAPTTTYTPPVTGYAVPSPPLPVETTSPPAPPTTTQAVPSSQADQSLPPPVPTTAPSGALPPPMATDHDSGVIISRQRNFTIPVRITEDRRADLRDILLYMSRNQGESWERVATIEPSQSSFTFQAPADGTYWFSVSTVHRKGSDAPVSILKGPPHLKVIVDTAPHMPSSPPPMQPAGARIDQAERDLAIAEHYLKTGHRGSAIYYYELVERRYSGTLYATQAARVLLQLRTQESSSQPPRTSELRIGQIIIVGNKHVPDSVIRDNLALYPGQILDHQAVAAAQDKLRGLKDLVNVGPIVSIRPTVTVVEGKDDGPYRDILVTVNESLRLDVLAELEKLAGTWTVVAATVDGKEVASMRGRDMVFSGTSLTMQPNPGGTRSEFTLDLSAKPKRMRIVATNGPAGALPTEAEYEIAGDTMQFTTAPSGEAKRTADNRNIMVLKLKRKPIEKATQSFHKNVEEARDAQALNLRSKNLVIKAATFAVQPDGRVKLTKAAIVHGITEPGNAPTAMEGEVIYLTLDRPVQSFSELGSRQIVSMDIQGGKTVTLRD